MAVLTSAAANLPVSYISSAAPTYSSREFPDGSSLTLTLGANPLPPGTLQWLRDEQPIAAATSTALTLPALSATDVGNYRLRITNGASISYSDTFTVNVLPRNINVVDTTFTSQLPPSFRVGSVTAFAANGSFVVQSSGSTSDSTVRLAADGSIVAAFHYPASAGTVLAGFADGRLITTNSPYLLAADGSPLTFTLPTGFDATKPLSGAAIATDGKFYLSQGTRVVRYLADATLDPSFSFSSTLDTSSTVYAVDRQGRVFVRGLRPASNATHFPPSWSVYYRLALNGSVDLTFSETAGVFLYSSARVQIVPLADGRIFHWSAYHGYYTWRMYNEDGSEIAGWSEGTFTDNSPTIDPVRAVAYLPVPGGALKRYKLAATGLVEDTTAFIGVTLGYSFPPFTIDPDGKLLLSTNKAAWENHPTQNLARIRTDIPRPVLPPQVDTFASPYSPVRGGTVTITSRVSGSDPVTYQWLALDGQSLPATTTSANLVISNFSTPNLGRYQLQVNGTFGTVLSSVVELSLSSTDLPYLANLSGRAVPGTGEDATIAGFATTIRAGALGVPLLIRGAGPALKTLGVTSYLPNPALDLHNASGTLVSNNDNWGASTDRDTIRTHAATTGAFAFADDSLDAALLKTSYTEQFTVRLLDQSNAATPGAGLVEIYRVNNGLVVGELMNLSLRARTGPGDATVIAGFVVVDPQNFDRPVKVLLRAVGPTLAASGISHPLENPVLTVYNSKGEIVASNDNWSTTTAGASSTEIATATKTVGAFDLPPSSQDAALLLDLPAGAYSMHATGGTGVVLLEIYLVR